MNKPKVVVTRRWPSAVQARLNALYDVTFNESDQAMSPQALQHALQHADALLSTVTDRIDANVLNVPNKRAKIIAQFGVGYNNIDIELAKQHGLIVTNTPHVLTDCTADIAMLLLLMSARRAAQGQRLIEQQQWTGWAPTQLMGQKVTGKTLGLVGFGRIAQAMARKAHHGFGMKILCYTRSAPDSRLMNELQASVCDTLDELLGEADFVSLHCPADKSTYHLINAQRLKLMRPNAHLINTARGDVVDTQALIDALKISQIAGAGLDVYEGEPTIDPQLLDLDNVTLLPHLGSATQETREAMGFRVLHNLAAYFAQQTIPDQVI